MSRRSVPPPCPGCGLEAHGTLVDACSFARLEARVAKLEEEADEGEVTLGNLLLAMAKHGLRLRGIVESGAVPADRVSTIEVEPITERPGPDSSGAVGVLDDEPPSKKN
jgi:hypothetical protein